MWRAIIAICLAYVSYVQAATKCEEQRQEYSRFPSPVPGLMYVPQCRADGSYNEVQCWTTAGYCWCVNQLGEEIPKTKQKGTLQIKDCSKYRTMTNCQLKQVAAEPGADSYLPQCNQDGSWMKTQCWPSTGLCWCVDEEGRDIEGTLTQDVPNC